MILNVIIALGIIGAANLAVYFLFPKYRRIAAIISRSFIGLLFMFSGFVKGVDPLGFTYKIEDYFIAYNMEWAMGLAFSLSVIVCAMEFTAGALLFFNIKTKYNVWLVTLMMLGFTCITFYDALYSPVPDCGCFGDAIKLTNWETFYKNVVIDLFLVLIILFRNNYNSFLKNKLELGAIALVFISFLSFEIYNYRNLPIIDFSSWKVGSKLYSDNPKPIKLFVKYKCKATGEVKEFLSPNYPYTDSIWLTQWDYDTSRVEDPNKYVNIMIEGKEGNDMTSAVIKNPDYQFIITSYNLKLANKESFKKISKLFEQIDSIGYSFVVLSSGFQEDFEKFKKDNNINEYLQFYNTDDIELKIMVRSNPGLMLIKNGTVLGKWHYNNIPSFEELQKITNKK
ncbi:MAG: BT_3928 family protein [Bacteroidota bacterium]